MKHSLKTLLILAVTSLIVGCAGARAPMPLQAQARPMQLSRMSTGMKVFRYKLMIPQEQAGGFMIDMDVSSELMGIYFGNPGFKSVYERSFVDSTQLRRTSTLIVSFDVFDQAAFTQQALPLIRQKLEVQGRKLVAY